MSAPLTGNAAEAKFRASNRLDIGQVVRQSCEAEEIPSRTGQDAARQREPHRANGCQSDGVMGARTSALTCCSLLQRFR